MLCPFTAGSSTARDGRACMTCSPPTAIGQRGAESDAVARSGRIGEYAARRFPCQRPQPPILPPQDGFLFLDRDKFHASFAADLSAEQAAFMADSQVPWAWTRLAARSASRPGATSPAG